jgi:Mn-dependent DtxR family transcriptional regulator
MGTGDIARVLGISKSSVNTFAGFVKHLRKPDMPKKMKKKRKALEPLEAIKRLLILSLMKQGADSKEIGLALDIDSSVIRRMMPAKAIKKLSDNG